MLRDDDETRAVLVELSALHGTLQISRLGYDGHGRQPSTPSALASVDELHAVTLRAWATYQPGEILTPIPTTPAEPDRCVEHFLSLYEREMQSAKSRHILSIAYRRETDR